MASNSAAPASPRNHQPLDPRKAEKIKNKSVELQKKLMEEFKELQEKYTKELWFVY